MKWRIYYFILAIISPFALIIFHLINKLPGNSRSRVLVVHPDGRVMLVMNALGDRKWTLPGGGLRIGEQPKEGAVREFREELGISLPADLFHELAKMQTPSYKAILFMVQLSEAHIYHLHHDPFEIYKWGWYRPDSLPDSVQPLVHEALDNLSHQHDVDRIE